MFIVGTAADPSAIGADVGRLYATRLFDSVAYTLEPLGGNRYRLEYIVKESPANDAWSRLAVRQRL